MIEVRGVSKLFGLVRALDEIDLELDQIDQVCGERALTLEALRHPAQGLAELLVRQVIVLAFDP